MNCSGMNNPKPVDSLILLCRLCMKRNADDKGIKLGESLAVRKKDGHLISKVAYVAYAAT